MTEPSTADMTGRTLEFLGWLGLRVGNPRIDRAVDWLVHHQREDSSWFGRWGIAYLYGTGAALCGLAAVGVSPRLPAVRRGLRWLMSVQNADGGFGESARSDLVDRYLPLGRSLPSQTAWATLALAAWPNLDTRAALAQAVDRLVSDQCPDGRWQEDYPTGAGFAGKIYLRYHSYPQVWPLLALAAARKEL